MRQVSFILLTLPDGKLVLQRRSKDAPRSPGLLGLFGGHVEKGETFDEAMIRELGEETSLDINKLTWGFVQDYILKPEKQSVVHFYLYWAEIPSANFKVFEGDGAEVYTREEALARSDIAPSCRYALTNVLKEKV